MTARRGRPGRARGELSTDRVLEAAVARLNKHGPKDLTVRALARDLGVTPMAIYAHVDGHAGLMARLAGQLFPADGRMDLSAMLNDYADRLAAVPHLLLAVLSSGTPMPAAAAAFTARVDAALAAKGADPAWRDILIDHLHGHALAVGLCAAPDVDYKDHLARLLAAMEAETLDARGTTTYL
ncbi:MAG: TetR family transcriptional regulator [Pseudomonadota bacterium]